MQQIIFDEPYEFIPPHRGRLVSWLFRKYLPTFMRTEYGVIEWECRHIERLKESQRAGHGIILAPNHCRPSDPMAMGIISREADTHVWTMASWHVFKQSSLQNFVSRRLGAFSIYREGVDRLALNCAIDLLVKAERPLVIFPEGVISRTNDRLGALMDGVGFIARAAAKKRAKLPEPGHVVIHPVALKYQFVGDLQAVIKPILSDIELRLTWQPHHDLPVWERMRRVGQALIGLKEVEFLGSTQTGTIYERTSKLIDHMLHPLEEQWLNSRRDGDVVGRVKALRSAILPDMVNRNLSEDERRRRWKHLYDVYLAQQINFYPRDYVRPSSAPERILETVERFEEDLTDVARVNPNLRLILEVGEPIDIPTQRERKGAEFDPVMKSLRDNLEAMLARLTAEIAVSGATAASITPPMSRQSA